MNKQFAFFGFTSFTLMLCLMACSKKEQQIPIIQQMYVGLKHVTMNSQVIDTSHMPHNVLRDTTCNDTVWVTIDRMKDSITFKLTDGGLNSSYTYKIDKVEKRYASFGIPYLNRSFLFSNSDSLYSYFSDKYVNGTITISGQFAGKLMD